MHEVEIAAQPGQGLFGSRQMSAGAYQASGCRCGVIRSIERFGVWPL